MRRNKKYKENEYFDEEWLGKEQEYISKLVESITADFKYKLNMQTSGVGFEFLQGSFAASRSGGSVHFVL